jgi:L-alanine-DL-glutamate epimerase-like enolase superfamily enzyme
VIDVRSLVPLDTRTLLTSISRPGRLVTVEESPRLLEMAHHEEPQVSAHVIASRPHGIYAECFHPDRDPFWWKLIATPRDLRDGYLTLSDEPGLGWTLDWDYLNRYRVE